MLMRHLPYLYRFDRYYGVPLKFDFTCAKDRIDEVREARKNGSLHLAAGVEVAHVERVEVRGPDGIDAEFTAYGRCLKVAALPVR